MYDYKVSAFPIVSTQTQTLLGTISASDLKGILAAPENIFDLLKMNCGDWTKLSKVVDDKTNTPSVTYQVFCYPNETLIDVIKRLAAHHVHRLWVLNQQTGKVIDVISLCDVINAFNHI